MYQKLKNNISELIKFKTKQNKTTQVQHTSYSLPLCAAPVGEYSARCGFDFISTLIWSSSLAKHSMFLSIFTKCR